jgi:gamma-glutamyltranspeptidase
VEQDAVALEEGLWPEAERLEALGYRVSRDSELATFGGGQAILLRGDALVGGSDPRKDGYAGGL